MLRLRALPWVRCVHEGAEVMSEPEILLCLMVFFTGAMVIATPWITYRLDRRYATKAIKRNREFIGPIEPIRLKRRLRIVR